MNKKITFKELVDQVGKRTDRKTSQSEGFIRELVDVIETGLHSGGSVSIAGFGKFELRWMDERKGVNPQTGEEITIPGQNRVAFKPYKSLREQVNRSYSNLEPRILDTPAEKGDTQSGKKEESGSPDRPEKEAHGEPPVESAEVVERDLPAAAEPFPFFVELDEESADESIDDLIVERDSPLSGERVFPTVTARKKSAVSTSNKDRGRGPLKWSWLAATILLLLLTIAVYYFAHIDRRGDIGNDMTDTLPDPIVSAEEKSVNHKIVEETEFMLIIVERGQTLWGLATEHMGDPYLWPWIYHLNSNILGDPNRIQPGHDLTVPVPSDPENLDTEERREVASGYVEVYRRYKQQQLDNAHHFLWAAGSFSSELLDEIEQQIDHSDLRFARNR